MHNAMELAADSQLVEFDTRANLFRACQCCQLSIELIRVPIVVALAVLSLVVDPQHLVDLESAGFVMISISINIIR